MNGYRCVVICSLLLTSVYAQDEVLQFPYRISSSPIRHKRKQGDGSCKLHPYGTRPNVKRASHGSNDDLQLTLPIVESHTTTQTVGSRWMQRNVKLHVAYVHNPVKTVSVYEPLHDGTCSRGNWHRATVMESAEPRHCLLAVNAGFFDTSSGECFGNIVSDGHLVQDSKGLQNVHFGITKKGKLFFGFVINVDPVQMVSNLLSTPFVTHEYLSEIDIVAEDFLQLVGGVIWVLKDGQPYVNESIETECADVEETGTLKRFASVVSARTLVGHDSEGRVVVVQADGKTGKSGMSLYEAAEILQKLGLVNAMNFDGGGSSTVIINNTLVSYPSDKCKGDKRFQCERPVTTILCVHEPLCDPQDCRGHGSCDLGVCQCQGYWAGEKCDRLECPQRCSGHGTCTEDGCVCTAGYHGDDCGAPCSSGWYGEGCIHRCVCENTAECSPVDGSCACGWGYQGALCQYRCQLGFYGDDCAEACNCDDVTMCDHETGNCNYTHNEAFIMDRCSSSSLDRQRRVAGDYKEEYRDALVTVIVLAVISLLSVVMNTVIAYKYCTTRRRTCSEWRTGSERAYDGAHPSNNGQTFIFHGDHSDHTSSNSSSADHDGKEEETKFCAISNTMLQADSGT